jgi:hypothetical protein
MSATLKLALAHREITRTVHAKSTRELIARCAEIARLYAASRGVAVSAIDCRVVRA